MPQLEVVPSVRTLAEFDRAPWIREISGNSGARLPIALSPGYHGPARTEQGRRSVASADQSSIGAPRSRARQARDHRVILSLEAGQQLAAFYQ